jgi:hypothetical protein
MVATTDGVLDPDHADRIGARLRITVIEIKTSPNVPISARNDATRKSTYRPTA